MKIEVQIVPFEPPIVRLETQDSVRVGRAIGLVLGRGMVPAERQELIVVFDNPATEKMGPSQTLRVVIATAVDRSPEGFTGTAEVLRPYATGDELRMILR